MQIRKNALFSVVYKGLEARNNYVPLNATDPPAGVLTQEVPPRLTSERVYGPYSLGLADRSLVTRDGPTGRLPP
jgi:hypothetical protein